MLQYILECIAFQLVFLIIFDLFLKGETFFQWNRLYLIGTYVISMVLPWIKIEAMKTTVPEAFQAYPEFLWNGNDALVAIVAEDASFTISWEFALLFGGMFLASLFFGYKLYQIYALRRKGEVHFYKDFTQITIANSSLAFSFFKSIFLGDKVIEKEHQNILEHELVHIRQRHSFDLMFFELMRIAGWFNPLVYVYQSRISELHEFIADAQVAKSDKKAQYEFLLSEVFQTQNISFINQFFKSSLIKKRIVMLQKTKSKKIWQLKYLLLVPMVLGMLAYTSADIESKDEIGQEQTSEDDFLVSKVKKNASVNFKEVKIREVIEVKNLGNMSPKEDKAVFDKLMQLTQSKEYWELYVKDKNSIMKFITSDNGSYVSGPNGEKIYAKLFIDPELDEDELDLFTSFLGSKARANFERETSADLYNKLVSERQRLLESTNEKNPIIVNLDVQIKEFKDAIIENFDTEPIPFAKVDEVPVFTGCENFDDKRACFQELMQLHISKNFNYPKEAQEKGIQGRVNVMFLISKKGNIEGLRMRGPDSILEKEVARIISRLPKMKPGKHKGKRVDVPFSIPISFKLNEENTFEKLPENSNLKSIAAIRQYNKLVTERSRLLRSSNEKNPIIVNLDEQLKNLRQSLSNSLKSSVDSFEPILNSKENNAILQYNQLIAERERLLISSNEKNPIIVNLDQQLASLKNAIDSYQTKEIQGDSLLIPFAIIDEVPIFPGCENEVDKRECFNKMMQKHISKNFNYPKEAQEKGIQGRVSVMFTIAEDGSIQNIRKRGPDSLLENEVERIIRRLPKMKPGKHKGKVVNVPFSIPITFKLNGGDDNIETIFKQFEIAGKKPLILIDGKESTYEKFIQMVQDDTAEIHLQKDSAAINKYGKKGKNGVLEITTRKKE